ncbi:uncharacterized protein [Aegilops tauschii subsp. strangulata]|uniref:uncharacterized protein n=1 Tax=Aegilops tauschii subsp. strangulata TaxID=200361 RepID=UPI00098B6D83|nr:uncharacterized protein LOC109784264 [Aegilops tauschii subsp. strangulata]
MSTTQTTPGDGTTEPSSGSARWSDLPDDLLGNVHVRIATLHDHVRLAAVCRSWRAATARLPAPPAVPLLLVSPCSNRSSGRKHLCGPDYAWVTRVPSKVDNKLFVGSHDGGWVTAFDNRELTLVNLFSSAEMPVRALRPGRLRQNPIAKIIFSDAPTSSNGCVLAAITDDRLNIALWQSWQRQCQWVDRDNLAQEDVRGHRLLRR